MQLDFFKSPMEMLDDRFAVHKDSLDKLRRRYFAHAGKIDSALSSLLIERERNIERIAALESEVAIYKEQIKEISTLTNRLLKFVENMEKESVNE